MRHLWRNTLGMLALLALVAGCTTLPRPDAGKSGYIIELENGFKIYHMGDTGLFGDMKLIGEHYTIRI